MRQSTICSWILFFYFFKSTTGEDVSEKKFDTPSPVYFFTQVFASETQFLF